MKNSNIEKEKYSNFEKKCLEFFFQFNHSEVKLYNLFYNKAKINRFTAFRES